MRRLLLPSLLLFALVGCQKARSPGGGTPGSATPLCGNGQLDIGETCDGNCPTSCDDGVACTLDVMNGSGCRVSCSNTPISSCTGGDGCCAEGCSNANDVDCSATCGDGVVDEFETCDGDCADCVSPDACTVATQFGSVANCNVECSYASNAMCGAADGCCPPGCTNASDGDCSANCGNNMLDPGETCDGDCPTTCPSTNCTTAMLVGDASTCTSTCTFSLISQCMDGDSCCPEGCEGMDDDCGQPPMGGVGSPCTDNATCQASLGSAALCAPAPTFPDGYCTIACKNTAGCPTGSACDIDTQVCVGLCGSGLPECRVGYVCTERLDTFESPYQGCLPGGE